MDELIYIKVSYKNKIQECLVSSSTRPIDIAQQLTDARVVIRSQDGRFLSPLISLKMLGIPQGEVLVLEP